MDFLSAPANCDAGGINGGISAADDSHALSHSNRFSQIDIPEEIYGISHADQVLTGDIQLVANVGAHSYQDCPVSFPEK
jgi:hypothetical protein